MILRLLSADSPSVYVDHLKDVKQQKSFGVSLAGTLLSWFHSCSFSIHTLPIQLPDQIHANDTKALRAKHSTPELHAVEFVGSVT
jgi:hypothetical protein